MKKPVKAAKAAKKPAPAKKAAKENKPIAKKSAKKREGGFPKETGPKVTHSKKSTRPRMNGVAMELLSPGNVVALDVETGHVYNASPETNDKRFEVIQKKLETAEFMESISYHLQNMIITQLRADSRALTRQDLANMIFTKKKKSRDLLGDDPKTFDATTFKACLDLLTTATSEPQFDPAQYLAALQDCDNAGLDVSAMLEVDAVASWKTADIERLISYLTTLCHIKRAVRSAPETNQAAPTEH